MPKYTLVVLTIFIIMLACAPQPAETGEPDIQATIKAGVQATIAAVPMAIASPTPASGPEPKVTGAFPRVDTYGTENARIHIECRVRNDGADGDIEVTAELQQNGWRTERERLTVSAGDTKAVTLSFRPSFASGQGFGYSIKDVEGYQCKAEPIR